MHFNACGYYFRDDAICGWSDKFLAQRGKDGVVAVSVGFVGGVDGGTNGRLV